MKNVLALVTVSLLFPAVAAAQQPAPGLQQASSYRVMPETEMCRFHYQTNNVRFTVIGTAAFENLQPPHLVLEERATMDRCQNQEGGRGEVTVTARPAPRPSAAAVWTIRQPGDQGEVWYGDDLGGEEMYRVTQFGCCGSETLHTYYSLRTGHRLFRADHPLLRVDLERVASGYVAIHSAMAADGGPGGETDRTQVARISFGGPGRVMQDAVIRGPSNDFYVSRFELVARGPNGQVDRGRRLDIDSQVRAGWTVNVAIEITSMKPDNLNPPHPAEILIPLENGRMAVDKARVPAPFRIAVVPRA